MSQNKYFTKKEQIIQSNTYSKIIKLSIALMLFCLINILLILIIYSFNFKSFSNASFDCLNKNKSNLESCVYEENIKDKYNVANIPVYSLDITSNNDNYTISFYKYNNIDLKSQVLSIEDKFNYYIDPVLIERLDGVAKFEKNN